jgi:hypothetical protein
MGLSYAVAVGGEPSRRIDVTVHHDALQFAYGWRPPRSTVWTSGCQLHSLTWTPCHFVGTRPLLRCSACGRRAASSISPSVPLLPAGGAMAAPGLWRSMEYPPPPPTRQRRHSGLTVAFNWPTVYFAYAFSPIKLSSGEDFGD